MQLLQSLQEQRNAINKCSDMNCECVNCLFLRLFLWRAQWTGGELQRAKWGQYSQRRHFIRSASGQFLLSHNVGNQISRQRSVKIVKYRSEFLCLSFGKTLKTREDGVSKLVAITRRGKKPLGTYWPERPTNYTQDRSSQTVRLPRTHPHKSDQVQEHEKNNSKKFNSFL